MKKLQILLHICTLCIAVLAPKFAGAGEADRQIAVTIDDLPGDAAFSMTATTITEINTNLLKGLRDEKIPAVGFVNEKKVYHWGEVDQRIKALAMWTDSGVELGNHGFSHLSLNNAGLKAWEDDVIHGENVIGLLLGEHNMKPRYFRHPYLATGRDLETRREAEAFLTGRGYRIAPVTIDPWDWMFGPVYADAKKRGDAALQQEVLNSYLSHADAVLAYDEQLSRETLGYEPKQILLLHDNQLNADHLKELAAVIRKRGYKFITLADALSDPAYSMPDTFVGEDGSGWLEHWAITLGKPPKGYPAFPAAISERFSKLSNPLDY
ncbi:MAG TPA: polysaccharide deacetylase family protein [Terriglobales bacterium]|nr:polysaccharide deacetylase family protein [Terriglobales bacterium]